MSDDLVPVPLADGAVRRLFDEPEFAITKRGYDPEGVARFLDELGARTVTLIQRLRGAEAEVKEFRSEIDDYRLRAEQAESSRELFDRTLVLAEETATASIEDAKERAERLELEAQKDSRRMVDETRLRVERMMDAARADVQQAYAEERVVIAQAQERLADESDQLETLRLAVAAETMALEEVRNELRRRIRRAATDLLGVAESDDCLGTPVTRGIPEIVARQTEKALNQESAVPDAPAATDDVPAIPVAEEGPSALAAPPQQTLPSPAATGTAPQLEPVTDAEEHADEPAGFVIDADPTVPIDLNSVESQGAEAEAEAEASASAGDAETEAFDRFMSDDIEDEPSRDWILT